MIKDAGKVMASGNTDPELTIIIATYNAEPYIQDCFDAIIANVNITHQIILIDGLSKDGTLNIVNNYQKHLDTVISEKDKGIYDAMNKALPYIKGKWVLFLGADDRILPTINKMESHLLDPNTVYYGNCTNNDQRFGGKFSPYKLAKMNLCHQAIFYPSAVFKKYQYNLNYPVFADYLLNIQCWGDHNFKKTYMDADIAHYNLEGFSSTATDQKFKDDKPIHIRKYLGLIVYLRYKIRKYKESKRPGSKFF